jgi:hypothetical protein
MYIVVHNTTRLVYYYACLCLSLSQLSDRVPFRSVICTESLHFHHHAALLFYRPRPPFTLGAVEEISSD